MRIRHLLPLALLLVGLGLAQPHPAGAASPLLAPPAVCSDQNDPAAPAAAQQKAMHCMIEFARRQAGLRALQTDPDLDWSATNKSDDILRCDSFSHYACGRGFTHWIKVSSADCQRAAENLAWGTGERATVRAIFDTLLDSPPHRASILGSYDQVGVGMRVGTLSGRRNVHVWTQYFGSRCAASRSQRRGEKI